MDQNEANLYVGQLFGGRYEIGSFRGSGAFSGVFEALDNNTGTLRAVKILSLSSSQNQAAVAEFNEEQRLLGVLSQCSNVVQLLDDGQHVMQIQVVGGGATVPMPVSFMVLELADATLADLLAQRHALAWIDRLRLYRDVVKGAHQMHLARIVNRDIKSDNVLAFDQPRNQCAVAKLSDFGRSKDTTLSPQAPDLSYRVGRGDPSYAPPELLWLQGESDSVMHIYGDLYLLGSIFFEFAVGVGLTAYVLGDPLTVYKQALAITDEKQREHEFMARIPDMRDDYELAYETVAGDVPPLIKMEAVSLLKQLTDPDPRARGPRFPFRGLPVLWDLQWLIRKVDIMIKRVEAEPPRSRRRRTRVLR